MPGAVLGAGTKGVNQVHGRGYCPGRKYSQCGGRDSAKHSENLVVRSRCKNLRRWGVLVSWCWSGKRGTSHVGPLVTHLEIWTKS